ncbi:pyridoxal phosphate-dependent aminotransferase [Rhodohalobacter sp. SW132]|uniref:pyridoxal phosphate-dependent aminotransferase n=1 Tax=Rhodohalobacter sp. SW132 TaxID=2293433 RepID=UPI000E22EBA8|nr:pyridoxal phosphate-dependent aminotransferase [Rhodohalobacter sp. SW132]REL24760.1 pyridoxal phosphate-dependent aminotransferase [Rhodohalobacter sp. SW132]
MISTRAEQLSESQTMKISGRAKELAREGVSIISLSAGEPDFKTPAHICNAAIEAITEGFHGYTMNAGMPELREAIVEKLKRDNGLDYSPDQIVLSNGAKQSVGFAILATINPGDEVLIPAPYWVSYPEMVKMAQGTPVPIRTTYGTHFKLTAEQLRDSITPKTRAIILCSPSNPTGACYTLKELKEIAEVLKEHPDILIFSDEIYEYIVFSGEHVGILNAAPELKDRTVLINGFSKGFAMTGWRLGYAAGPKPIISALAKIQSQETSAPSSISQKAGLAAYTGTMAPVAKMREAFKERRDFMVKALNEIEGVDCFTPSGAFYIFPDIQAFLGKTTPSGTKMETSTDLCMYLLEKHGVAAVPGDAFGEPGGLRLSYASSIEQLKEAVIRLKNGFDSLS